jgi:hypothetical protein
VINLKKHLLDIESEKLRIEKERVNIESIHVTNKITLPPFTKETDKFDSYISRIESIATSRKLQNVDWPPHGHVNTHVYEVSESSKSKQGL